MEIGGIALRNPTGRAGRTFLGTGRRWRSAPKDAVATGLFVRALMAAEKRDGRTVEVDTSNRPVNSVGLGLRLLVDARLTSVLETIGWLLMRLVIFLSRIDDATG
ncbi:hypothetical protein GW17_00025679 [Ensete ventricosum]|nr:hypothetical protein GW17_00025679 [Ensete ventricosum]